MVATTYGNLFAFFHDLLFGPEPEGGCCECWKPMSPFFKDHLGYDNVIAWWGVFIIAFLTVPLTLYYVCLNYTNMFAYIYFMAAIVFTLAVGGILYTSYPPSDEDGEVGIAKNWESQMIFDFISPILAYILPEDHAVYLHEMDKKAEPPVGGPSKTEKDPLLNKDKAPDV